MQNKAASIWMCLAVMLAVSACGGGSTKTPATEPAKEQGGLGLRGASASTAPAKITADATPFLGECQKSQAPGGAQFACGPLLAIIGDFPNLTVEVAVSSMAEGMRAGAGGEMRTAPAEFRANGKAWSGLAFSIHRPGEEASLFDGRFLGLRSSAGVSRVVMCGAKAGEEKLAARCEDVLVTLAESAPGAFAVPPSKPVFAGKPVEVPEGCETKDAQGESFRIACGEDVFLASTEVDSEEKMTTFGTLMREQMLKAIPGSTAGEDRPCKIGGKSGTCGVINFANATGTTGAVYLGSAVIGEHHLVVQCGQPTTQVGMHPLCAQALTLEKVKGKGNGVKAKAKKAAK